MNKTFPTKNIELAATIQVITGIEPEISIEDSGLSVFSFPMSSQDVESVVMGFESGIQADARKLLTTRNHLFKRIKGGVR